MSDENQRLFRQLLARIDAQPVLVDVGASGAPPAIWSDIGGSSTFVGFDPDLREMRDVSDSSFSRALIFNEAVTDDSDMDRLDFYLTESPYCSSVLQPDTEALEQYVFSDLFRVESKVSVRATTLDEVVRRAGLSRIDWLKLDTQGTDLRLFAGLSKELKAGVLAIDVEPGLIDAYKGEDLFADTHKALIAAGFWLSALDVRGTVRVKKSTREAIRGTAPDLDPEVFQRRVRSTPCWCEARYLRKIEWLAGEGATEREHILLWVFAVIEMQFGFALDVAYDMERRFPASLTGGQLVAETIARLKTPMGAPVPEHTGDPAKAASQISKPKMLMRWLRRGFSAR